MGRGGALHGDTSPRQRRLPDWEVFITCIPLRKIVSVSVLLKSSSLSYVIIELYRTIHTIPSVFVQTVGNSATK